MQRHRIDPAVSRFVKLAPQVEAVVQYVGATGRWVRDVYPSAEEAEAVADRLGIRVHHGWDDARIGRRIQHRDQWSSPGGQRRAV
jgi:hypothetical protein